MSDPTPDAPIYTKFLQTEHGGPATALYGITCDEGWRSSIICADMYEWAADWLLTVLEGRRFAPEHRP